MTCHSFNCFNIVLGQGNAPYSVGCDIFKRGTLGVPNTRKKNWQIPKNLVKNRPNTDTAFMICHAYLKLSPSRVFVNLKHLYTSNQPQPFRGNVRRP